MTTQDLLAELEDCHWWEVACLGIDPYRWFFWDSLSLDEALLDAALMDEELAL